MRKILLTLLLSIFCFANEGNFPEDLEITSVAENGEIMSIRHKHFNVKGVQFHPESILSEYGETIIKNWLQV